MRVVPDSDDIHLPEFLQLAEMISQDSTSEKKLEQKLETDSAATEPSQGEQQQIVRVQQMYQQVQSIDRKFVAAFQDFDSEKFRTEEDAAMQGMAQRILQSIATARC